eukprot:jgi/Chlat1/2176/Chrsp17S02751
MMVSTATATAMGVVVPTAASVSSSAGACRSRTAAAPAYTGLRRARAASRTASARLQARVARSSGRASSSGRMVVRCDVGEEVEVEFILPHQVNFGEEHAIIGSAPAMGNWNQDNAAKMQWTEKGWHASLRIPKGQPVHFKYVVMRNGGVEWEQGNDRTVEFNGDVAKATVECKWGEEKIKVEKVGSASAPSTTAEGNGVHAESHEAAKSTATAEHKVKEESKEEESGVEFSKNVAGWQGREVNFMRSNEHAREREGLWDTTGLQGVFKQLVEGDQKSGSWRKKLLLVESLLSKEPGQFPETDALLASAMYLQWIGTGAIPCVEDGGHYRPNAHAESSRRIFRTLEWMSAHPSTSLEDKLVIRRIHPQLPAFTAEFTASVPLTRIRDIAHRNDIPQDLKQEIKHTIQNKLHRNAGPEDLVATELMLQRVTAKPGEYNEAFIKEFRLFHKELKDFFNAANVTERLDDIKQSLDDSVVAMIESLGANKQKMDELNAKNGKDGSEQVLRVLHDATGVRAALMAGMASGLRNDASDQAIAMRQKWRLAEIGLEEYCFTLISRLLNVLDAEGGAEGLVERSAKGVATAWNAPLGAAVLALRNVGMSGWQAGECISIEHELEAWQTAGGLDGTDPAAPLRLKATLERARRIASEYSDTVLRLYPKHSSALGKALAIPENTVKVFAEGEIRANLVFQLAKVCTLLLKAVRKVSSDEGWDVLVTGDAVGTLTPVERIAPGQVNASGPVVLLVKKADGDEEVRAAGENVKGVILLQELPHLSHLGVRARQEHVVFVTCEDEDKIRNLQGLVGKSVRLHAASDGVKLQEEAAGASSSQNKEAATVKVAGEAVPAVAAGKVNLSPGGTLLALEESNKDRGGAKSAACAQLANLAAKASAEKAFKTPAGCCIPFGAMEAAVDAAGKRKEFEKLLDQLETAPLEGGELERLCNQMKAIISAVRIPKDLISKIGSQLGSDKRLIVRSSANVEDLAGMSGAGLYDSIPNVRTSEPEDFAKAVAEVWASLYTRRAVLSRRVAGVKQRDAVMSVLVQELLAPSLSFVLHTVSPVDLSKDKVYAEIAVGLGETLASGTRGAPWRLLADKNSGKVQTLAFANFSEAMVVEEGGRADAHVKKVLVDYSKQALSTSGDARSSLGKRLAAVGAYLEEALGVPQDVEGGVVGDDVYIVQTRPQPL